MIVTGLDRLLDSTAHRNALRAQRVGFLGHAASVTRDFEHAIDALIRIGVRPHRLFGPEHGLRGQAQMMIAVDHGIDPISGIPIQSLYGDDEPSLQPQRDAVRDLDVILIDIQDVGARYYTYVATALKLCAIASSLGVKVWVLDRPNPLGRTREGPGIQAGFHSFVGALAVPIRHGLSVAELFTWASKHHNLTFDVMEVSGWNPQAPLSEEALPWVMPSPNMPTIRPALVYPGGGLLEGTNVSEGRGTTRPFEVFGAPWIDAPALRERMAAMRLPGVAWRTASFRPTFDKYAGEICYGLQAHILDIHAFGSLGVYACLLSAIRAQHPEHFGWRPGAYEFVEDIPALDLLAGSSQLRVMIERAAPASEILAWAACEPELIASCREAERYA